MKFIKMFALIIIMATTFNCGTAYYSLKDGELPETEREKEKVNWLAIVGNITTGITIPIVTATPAGMASAIVFISIDYITGCFYEKTEVKK